jgi:hypothetical protein
MERTPRRQEKLGLSMTEVNSLEALLVQKDMQDKGYDNFRIRPGNDCVWASVSRGNGIWLDFYYIFREGRIVDIQMD